MEKDPLVTEVGEGPVGTAQGWHLPGVPVIRMGAAKRFVNKAAAQNSRLKVSSFTIRLLLRDEVTLNNQGSQAREFRDTAQ